MKAALPWITTTVGLVIFGLYLVTGRWYYALAAFAVLFVWPAIEAIRSDDLTREDEPDDA